MRCPSAKRVSNANDDLPEPDRPVITTSLFRGMATSIFFRLCTLAPLMIIYLLGIKVIYAGRCKILDSRIHSVKLTNCILRLTVFNRKGFLRNVYA